MSLDNEKQRKPRELDPLTQDPVSETSPDTALTASTAYPAREDASWPKPLRGSAHHGTAGQLVSIVAPHTEADPAAILIQFLVAFGNLIGRSVYFLAEAHRHHPNLFAALVGETSKARKGSSKRHVMDVLHRVEASWAVSRQQSGLVSGEGLIWHVRDPSKDDNGVDDKRLFLVEEEFSSVLRIMRRPENTLSPVLRQAWDSGDLQTLAKNSPAKATGAHVSLVGHSTVEDVNKHLDRTEIANGFANRFLWILVKRAQVLPDGGQLDPEELDHVVQKLKAVAEFWKKVTRKTEDDGLQLERNPEARQLWHDVYESLSSGKPGVLGAVISRSEAQVMRIALIYAVLDQSRVIRKEHLEAGLAVWHYCEESARFVFGESLGNRIAERILAQLRCRPNGMTRNDIREFLQRNVSAAETTVALALLQKLGLARMRKEPTPGRPAERWFATEHYPHAVDAVDAVTEPDE